MIYEYRCKSCDVHVELEQPMSDAAITTCPSCAGEALVRLVTGGGGFLLRGGGWFKDGYTTPAGGRSTDPKGK